MRPMTAVAIGLAVVAVDLRVERFDVLADPIGWLLVAEGCRRLALRLPMGAAVAAAVLSTAEVWLPHHTQTTIVAGHVSRQLLFDRVTGVQLVALVLAVVAGGVTLWLLLGTLARAADADDRRWLAALRWLVVVAWVVPFVVTAAVQHDGFDAVWNGGGRELVALAGIAALGLTAVQLLRSSSKRWALPPPMPLRTL